MVYTCSTVHWSKMVYTLRISKWHFVKKCLHLFATKTTQICIYRWSTTYTTFHWSNIMYNLRPKSWNFMKNVFTFFTIANDTKSVFCQWSSQLTKKNLHLVFTTKECFKFTFYLWYIYQRFATVKTIYWTIYWTW
jgi:hypothetical protein